MSVNSQSQLPLPTRIYRCSLRNLRKALARIVAFFVPLSSCLNHFIYRLCASRYQPLYPGGRADSRLKWLFNERWEAICKELGPYTSGSALDIGCNVGFFSFHLNELGYQVQGVEADPLNVYLCNSVIERRRLRNISFLNGMIDEAHVNSMPSFEVVLCLSVFHHIIRDNGEEKAREILSELISKTERVIFMDIGHSSRSVEAFNLPSALGDDPVQWMTELLTGCGCQQVNVIGHFDTSAEIDEKRYLFAGWTIPPPGIGRSVEQT